MRPQIWRTITILALLAMLIAPFHSAQSSPAAAPDQLQPGMHLIKASYVGKSQPLGSLKPILPDPKALDALSRSRDRLVMPKTQPAGKAGFDASIVQGKPIVGASMPSPAANFEGVGNINGVLPPDTQGDIGYDPDTGTKYYVQWVNLSFKIWDVTTPAAPVVTYGPAAGNTLWAGTGTICASHNDGDPITQFDHLANRWLMSQFALEDPDNYHQCIAISASADPNGSWYLYDYQTSDTVMNDYPKFGVWPDGYYMTVNQFDGTTSNWAGAGVAVFERNAMLDGLPADMIYIDIGEETLSYGGMLPSDLDGPAPPAGTPNYFLEWDDSTWLGDPADTLRIWEFHVDWDNPSSTTFGLSPAYAPNATLTTSNVNPDMCSYARSCVPQPGTTQGLDAISDRLMYRLQFRYFADHQTLLTNHTVDASGADKAGVHWFELRKSGASWSLFQEGVYAPDTSNRWMGSIAMDDSGDIALGYSVSSSTIYPSIRYTGRLAADPKGVMAQGEATLIAGSGSQTHSAARWGDYSMMALDPADGCTFWYTQEYIQTTGSAFWQTRIGSFKFPSCTALPTGELSGTVTDGTDPLEGALIATGSGYTTLTDDTGSYTLKLVVGNYDVTASKYGYSPETVNVDILAGTTTTQNFVLEAANIHTVSGVATDGETGWPLYAAVDISGYPDSPIYTDPVTGEYEVELVEGNYTFTAHAMSGGYTDAVEPVSVAGDMTQDFKLFVEALSCSAPGYFQDTAFSEDFESWPLADWSVVDNTTGGLLWDSSDFYGDGNFTSGDGSAADVNSDNNMGAPYDTELISPVIDYSSLGSLDLTYKANFKKYDYGSEALDLDISTDSGATWTNISQWTESHGTSDAAPGELVSVDLSTYTTTDFQLRWHYYTPDTSPWDYYAQVDEVRIGASCLPIPDSGLVVGAVYDANTDQAIPDPRVVDESLNPAVIIDNTDDPNQDHPLYVIAGTEGAVKLTASALRYAEDTQTTTVVAGSTVRQDFSLAAGWLSADPTSLEFNVTIPAPTDSKPLDLDNLGGADAAYRAFAIPGVFAGYAPHGPFADHTRHIGPKNLHDRNASKLRINLTPLGVPELDAGDVIDSWVSGLEYPWGVGFNLDAGDLWIGNLRSGGGDDLDYRFLTDGTLTGDTIDTSPWVSIFAADMTYNPFTGMLWQVNVGGDNCVYELDPVSMLSTGGKICPPFGTSERGLAFDPLTNTYYAGSWNDGIINHFAADGTLIDSAAANLGASGLAFNPATGHLFVLTNHANDLGLFDFYVLDTLDDYSIVGAFNLQDGGTNLFSEYGQAGLEMDCDGNLWAVDQNTQTVYVASSGESGVCGWQSTWLSAAPASGSVLAGGSAALTASADATGLPLGTYHAYLRFASDTPYPDQIVQATLIVGNSAPTANDQPVTTLEDNPIAVTLTASDPDGDLLTYSVVDPPDHGDLTGTAPHLTYTPENNFNGDDSFTFKANDGKVDSNIATVTIHVTPVNDAPVIVYVQENTTLVAALPAADPDSPDLSYSIIGGADASFFTVGGTSGILSFISAPNFEAPLDADHNNLYVVTVQVSDGDLTDTLTFHVVVTNQSELYIPLARKQ